MSQKIHYQDDLYLLSVLVKALESGLSVEADPEFFRERLSGDIFFLDSSIRTFHELLEQNTHLIDRAEYVKLLERITIAFVSTVENLVSGNSPEAQAYEDYTPQLRSVLIEQRQIATELSSIRIDSTRNMGESELVSQDELSELLKI